MVVISLSFTTSNAEVLQGIPKTVAIEASIPSTIFYTLDNTDPTYLSSIYISPIYLPIQNKVVLKAFATNGADTSPIIEMIYETAIYANNANVKMARSGTNQLPDSMPAVNYDPFGRQPSPPNNLVFTNPGDAAIPVSDPTNSTQIIEGYGADGNPNVFINNQETDYNFKYSITDKEGATGRGIGNLPAQVIYTPKESIPEQSSINSNLFNPKSYVIFQDASKENPADPPNINKQFFVSIGYEYDRFGNLLSGESKAPITGAFVRQHFNPRDNTMTYYYFDSSNSKWIISKQPFDPASNPTGILASKFISKPKNSVGYVFPWRDGATRYLF